MFDTVTIFLEQTPAAAVSNSLSEIQEITNTNTGETFFSGNLKNLKVKVKSNGVSLFGSLAKFHLGNNLETLTRKDTEQAIEELSDTLSLPMHKGKVYRFDVAQNFVLANPLYEYLSQFGDARYFKKSELKNKKSLLYTNSKRAMSFYDKLAELKKQRESIPAMFQHRNVLRYEIQFRHKIAAQFHQQSITAAQLFDESFYISAVNQWHSNYFSIHKKKQVKFQINTIKDVRKFKDQLALGHIQTIGEQEIISMIEQSKNELSKMQYQRLKQKVREITNSKALTESSEVIAELDTKVNQVAMYYR